MHCTVCNHTDSKVIDSRPSHDSCQIRRRRECLGCQSRFTTYEIIEEIPLLVVKRDGRREEFSRQKILTGLRRATQKRPVAAETLERIVDEIRQELQNTMIREVPYRVIGEMVMDRLSAVDLIAYVRFASVYKDFQDPRDFMVELENLFLQQRTRDEEIGTGGSER